MKLNFAKRNSLYKGFGNKKILKVTEQEDVI